MNILELGFFIDQKIWKYQLIPVDLSKRESDRIIDLLIYQNHYVVIKNSNVFLGNHNCNFVCRTCLSFKTCQIMLKKNKEKTEQTQEITTVRTSDESHLY